jgi:hypothetical protein
MDSNTSRETNTPQGIFRKARYLDQKALTVLPEKNQGLQGARNHQFRLGYLRVAGTVVQ